MPRRPGSLAASTRLTGAPPSSAPQPFTVAALCVVLPRNRAACSALLARAAPQPVLRAAGALSLLPRALPVALELPAPATPEAACLALAAFLQVSWGAWHMH